MKKLLFSLLLFAGCSSPLWAPINPSRVNIKTEDGSVNTYPYQARFSNGSVTDNNDGTVSILSGSVALTSSGIAFGSVSNSVTSDTTTFSWDNTSKRMTINTTYAGGFFDLPWSLRLMGQSGSSYLQFSSTDTAISPVTIAVYQDFPSARKSIQFGDYSSGSLSDQVDISWDNGGSIPSHSSFTVDAIMTNYIASRTSGPFLKWPTTDGSSSQCLQTNGSGILSFGLCGNASLASTNTWSAAQTFASSTTLAGAVIISAAVTITGNYAATGTDSVIYANVTGSTITITLPTAANNGQLLTIYKVDTGTNPVILDPAGSDTIVGLSSTTLWAYGAQQTLRADGTSTWWPVGRLSGQPQIIGNNQDIASAATGVSSTTYYFSWRLDDPCDTKSFRFFSTVSAGQLTFVIQNETGTIVVSSGPFSHPGINGQTVNLAKTNLQPGLYYVGIAAGAATATFTRFASDQVGGTYSKSASVPPTNLGYPPSFDSATSVRSPAITVQCYGGPPAL